MRMVFAICLVIVSVYTIIFFSGLRKNKTEAYIIKSNKIVLSDDNYIVFENKNDEVLIRFFRDQSIIGEVYFKENYLGFVSDIQIKEVQKIVRIVNSEGASYISANVANENVFFSVRDINHDLIPEYLFKNSADGLRAFQIKAVRIPIDLKDVENLKKSDLFN